MKAWIQKNKWNCLALASYLLLNGVLLWCYDPWRDVAQAWLIARDLSVPELFAQLRYEGHPCLWYLLLMPFAKLGFPYPLVGLISLALMTAAAVLLLWRAPFRWYVRCLCLFGALGTYYLPVIARSYALVPPLCCLLAAAYPARHARPVWYAFLLFLLSQVHVILCGMVGVLMLYWALEELTLLRRGRVRLPRSLAALGLMLAGVTLLAFLLPSAGTNPYASWHVWKSAAETAKRFGYTLLGIADETLGFSILERGNTAYRFMMLPFFGVLLGAMVCWFRRSPRMAALFTVSVLWHAVINTFIYSGSTQRFVVLGWQYLLCAWLSVEERRVPRAKGATSRKELDTGNSCRAALGAALAVLSLLSVPTLYEMVRLEVGNTEIISTSGEAAGYIRSKLPEDAVIIVDSEVWGSAVAAYFPRGKFYNPIRGSFDTFATWDGKEDDWYDWGDLDAALMDLREKDVSGEAYLLCEYKQGEAAAAMAARGGAKLKEIKSWTQRRATESYRLYRVIEPER